MSKDEKKEKNRFNAKPEELTVIFRPQCIQCKKNINKDKCKEFDSKPEEYMTNKVDCPVKENRK